MEAYAIELLDGRAWKRLDTIFWTRQIAECEARSLLNKGKGCEVRILHVEVSLDAVGTVTKQGGN